MEVEYEEAPGGEVGVKADEDVGAAAVGRLKSCVTTEHSQLRARCVQTIPESHNSTI